MEISNRSGLFRDLHYVTKEDSEIFNIDISTSEVIINARLYVEQFTYIDVHGKIRYRDTHRIVEEDEIIKKFDISKFEEMENEFKYLAMHKSKRVIEWLENTYKDKTIALVNRLTAAKLLLEYGPSKAAQRKETSTTIKKMEIQIRGTLPQGLKIEDF